MIDEANARRVESWVNEAHENGARLIVEPKRDGARLSPGIVEFNRACEGEGIRLVDEEVFGPILTGPASLRHLE